MLLETESIHESHESRMNNLYVHTLPLISVTMKLT